MAQLQGWADWPPAGEDDTAPRVHDPSTIIKCKDEYWVFATGIGIQSYRSPDLVHWRRGPSVFTRPPAWATNAVPGNRGHFWAPDVIYLDGRYLLYYSVSTFGKNTSAIGLVTNTTLDPADPRFKWVDCGMVIQSHASDPYNTIDPAVFVDAENRFWLVFGSFWTGIKMIELDRRTGLRIAPDSPIYSLAYTNAIEAPYIYRRGNWYYLFVNWGICCRGAHSTYEIRVGRSLWPTGPYLDATGRDLLHGGGTFLLGSMMDFVGPGHAAVLVEPDGEYLSCNFYDRGRMGRPTLAIFKLEWDTNNWPVIKHTSRLQ